MLPEPDPQTLKIDSSFILYDARLMPQPSTDLFNPHWLAQQGEITPAGNGRGEAWFVQLEQQQWVLRHYMRGGMVAHFNRHHYVGWRLARTRPWKEWHLLHDMHALGLPVPRPVAAKVSWPANSLRGLYQAWLLVERIPGARTLADSLRASALSDTVWETIGATLRRFHDQQVFHADLNANNILLDAQHRVFLIDFDRGEFRRSGPWKQANVQRLLRSLSKLQTLHAVFHFEPNNWQSLLQGYQVNIAG